MAAFSLLDGRASARTVAQGGYSFSAAAGPLPEPVLQEVAAACLGRGAGACVLGLPFTSQAYRELQHDTEVRLRRLLDIPAQHRVLFMQGGASAQFTLVPFNLLGPRDAAAYADTGHWSRRAAAEAARHACVQRLGLDAHADADALEAACTRPFEPGMRYLHVTSNETADGWQWPRLPRADVPLVVDATSDLLTRAVDFRGLGLLYASAQKTLGVPGLTLVVVREDLLGRARHCTPATMNYTALAAQDSRLNTPPVFAIFVARAMLGWIERQGGVAAMARAAQRRSAAVYRTLDVGGGFYITPARRPGTLRAGALPDERVAAAARARAAQRSRINPCFGLADEALTPHFLRCAQAAGLFDLQGHPEQGGLRVSLYNGTPEAAVSALVGFLREFERTHG